MKASSYLTPEQISEHNLNKLPIFKKTDSHYLEQFFSMCQVQTFKTNEVILEQGTTSTWLYVLLSGKLSYRMNQMEVTVFFKRGDIFSEAALLDPQPSPMQVVALEDASVLALDAVLLEDFHASGEQKFFLTFYKFLSSQLCKRLSAISTELSLVKSVTHRLAQSDSHPD